VAALAVVSLVAKERHTWTGASLSPYIRLDVGLQPTAAGGAVIDAQGRVVGMATGRFARYGAVAIPASAVNAVVDVLLQKGRIPRGYLGVGLQPLRLPDELRKSLHSGQKTAVIVLQVEPDGPASKAGMMIGDILISLEGQPVTRLEDVQSHLNGDTIGKRLAVKFLRGGALHEAAIVVSERQHGDK
jgi:S1-C subfamily serine protease